jgi:hypothetical protein
VTDLEIGDSCPRNLAPFHGRLERRANGRLAQSRQDARIR